MFSTKSLSFFGLLIVFIVNLNYVESVMLSGKSKCTTDFCKKKLGLISNNEYMDAANLRSVTGLPKIGGMFIHFIAFADGEELKNVDKKIRTKSEPGNFRAMQMPQFNPLASEHIVVYTRIHAYKDTHLSDQQFKEIATAAVKKSLLEPFHISLNQLKAYNVQIMNRLLIDQGAVYNGPIRESTLSIQTTFVFSDPMAVNWIKTKIN